MRAIALALVLTVAGCSSLVARPMVARLQPEQQSQIDDSWDNMLSPPERLDRMLLLDTVLAGQLYQIGADRVQFRSEKQVRDGTVTMEVFYSRHNPDNDRFTIRYVDGNGLQRRFETYTRQEVDERFEFLAPGLAERRTTGHECAELSDEERDALQKERKAQLEAREREIRAATQPADGP